MKTIWSDFEVALRYMYYFKFDDSTLYNVINPKTEEREVDSVEHLISRIIGAAIVGDKYDILDLVENATGAVDRYLPNADLARVTLYVKKYYEGD